MMLVIPPPVAEGKGKSELEFEPQSILILLNYIRKFVQTEKEESDYLKKLT